MDFWTLGYFGLRAIVFVLTCLTLGIALSRARGHVAWLLPSCIGQALSMYGTVVIFAYTFFMTASGNPPGISLRWLLVPQQITSALAMLCVVWAAVALYATMRTLTAGALSSKPGREDKEIWPPPPSQ